MEKGCLTAFEVGFSFFRRMNVQGWIKLHRRITENEFWCSEKFTRAQAWIDLLLLCNHKPSTIFIKGVEIHLAAGELAWSQLSLAARWRWDIKKVRRFLSELERREMVETRTDNKTTTIRAKNWALYQCNGDQKGEQTGDQKGEQKESRLPTDKNVERMDKMEREEHCLPESVEKVKALFTEKDFLNPDIEASKFFAYYGARGWKGMSDWRALAQCWNERTKEHQSSLEPGHARLKPLGDDSWKSQTFPCSDCGRLTRADEICACSLVYPEGRNGAD